MPSPIKTLRAYLDEHVLWGIRLVFQFAVYSPKLWRGKRFETMVHVVFGFFWLYLTVVFALASGLSA